MSMQSFREVRSRLRYRRPVSRGRLSSQDTTPRIYVYASGSLPKVVGNKISSLTNLATLFGPTETGYRGWRLLTAEIEHMNYSPFNGYKFRPYKEVGLYEQFIVRKYHLDLLRFFNIPQSRRVLDQGPVQATRNQAKLVEVLRTDDVTAFSNAEKHNPADSEDTMCSHSAIKSALMGGHGEFQSCLLIDSMKEVEDESGRMSLLELIWPKVQEANQTSPAHARVMKDFILFTRKEKPPERAGKGTVQRVTTLQLYQGEIDRLYKSPELSNISPRVLMQPREQQSMSLCNPLYQMTSASIGLDSQLSYDADLFALGLDSLQTLAFSKNINAYLMQSTPTMKPITPSTIYTHSSIEELESDTTAAAAPSIKETSDAENMQ